MSAVTFRSLGFNKHTGTIPPQISLLTELRVLYAVRNQIYEHSFSASQVNLFRDLEQNQLTGTIPAVISTLLKLRTLCASLIFHQCLSKHFKMSMSDGTNWPLHKSKGHVPM